MPIRLEDLLSSFRRHFRPASKAPPTIELSSPSVPLPQPLADRPPPRAGARRADPACDQRAAGRARQELGASDGGDADAAVLPVAVVEGELDRAPTEEIEIAVAPEKPVPNLNDAEITALLKTCGVGRGRSGTYARPIFRPPRRGDHAAVVGLARR